MAEIKINQQEIEAALNDLKNKIEGFQTSSPNMAFRQSRLDMIDELANIEEQYYMAIQKYKDILMKTEEDMRILIQQFVEKDQELSQTMK
ncbi:DUF5344 family protein [Bacillus sp. P14.5]|uniref:DUF5344 family protein n=1 Tax=Bacillus sp. P14.5 TaxID=1983400 RepID=UPI000DEA9578|nr:DUF5344 family protein [Bacillus sp. P14.5]